MMQNKNVKRVLNMTDEWNRISADDATLVMGCVIARKEFVEQNPAAVKKFLEEYEASIKAVKAEVENAATLCETYKVIPKAALAKMAIPNCGLVYKDKGLMRHQLEAYLKVLYAYNPAAIGGQLPAEDFYYVG